MNQIRTQIAIQWLNLPPEKLPEAYAGELGNEHRKILESHLRYEPLSDAEKAFVDSLLKQSAPDPGDGAGLKILLAVMLYRRADQLPLNLSLAKVPVWFINDYMKYLCYSPNIFQELGEAENYARYMQNWLTYLYDNILSNLDSPFWKEIAWFFTWYCGFIPLYFSTANLKDIYSKRADIMAFALTCKGFKIDHTFEPRPADRQKIRIGFLNSHFITQTETYATIPAFDELDRTQFELILYTINLTGHPLEQYCKSKADKLVQLSGDLAAQAQAIRSDDLDILWVGTNVTAVTNPITPLALHRLARIQLTSINSPTTTGIKSIDYYIGGTLTASYDSMQDQYREKLLNVEGSGICFRFPFDSHPAVTYPKRSDWGVSDNTVIFISGANFYKILPELRHTYAKIMAKVPDSILVLYPFNPNWTKVYPEDTFIRGIKAVFREHGVDENRLKIVRALPGQEDVKACLKLADIYLDSFPYGGATSLIDPLSVNLLPVVLEGNALRFRQAPAMLREIGLSELVVNNEDAYIQLAVKLADDAQLRLNYRQQIMQKMADKPPFLDSKKFSAKIGELLKQLVNPVISEKEFLTSEFMNLMLGTSALHEIDPADSPISQQLREIRRKLADFWIKIPSQQLESVYTGEGGIAERAVLESGFRTQPMLGDEGAFVQSLITELTAKTATDRLGAMNYLLATMLYLPKERLNIQDARSNLPGWLIGDYEKFFLS